MKKTIKTETVKKARLFNPDNGVLTEPIFMPYDPKIGEIYTLREQGQLIYQLTPTGGVTQ